MRQLITLLLILSVFICFSQTKEQDSLTIQLAFQKSDTSKVETSLKLIKSLYDSKEYAKSLKFISESEKLSNTLNYQKGNAEITYYKALIFAEKDDYINAIDNYTKSKDLFIVLKDTLSIAKVNNSIGLIEIARGNYNKGLQYSLSAIIELEKRGLNKELCSAYKNLADAYEHINNRAKAIEFNLKRLEIEKKLNDKIGIISTHKKLAELYSLEKENRKAIDYYEKVLRDLNEENDSLKGEILPRLGGEYLQFKDYDVATGYLLEGLKLNRQTDNQLGLLISLNNLGKLNLQQNKTTIAEIQLTEAGKIAETLENDQQLLMNYRLMTVLDSTNRNYERAFERQRDYYNLKRRIELQNRLPKVEPTSNVPSLSDINAISKSVESNILEQHEQENTENEKKLNDLRFVFYILLAVFAILLIFFVLIYSKRNSRLKYTRDLEEKNQKIELQNAAILEQTKHLEDINKVKDRLFSIVSHDLKDSLTSIKGFIDLLNDGSLTQSEFNSLIPELSENANNASLLLFNLLNWSKSQMQSLESNPSLFDIQEVFEEKTHLLEQKLEKKGITLINQTLHDFVYADRSMIEIVVQNLLTNAIKFSKSGDTITVANRISNGRSIISISDTGVGIAPENIEKLFKNSTFTTVGTSNEKGTGLGLTICKELVDLNMGKIWVESSLNRGTTFYIELPKSNPVV
ncbi:tetratricopeptide repeat-containing sensor histidine kinase [Bizionia sp. M204]|uniref:ATP-binding protein n=1 Tax=unclassified Bizionia TaxID=2626393 RepID=UPI002046C2C2|nr:tetratricopeptide repeat-containing sensor histidine kinase [Bizionia sp. M204]UPS90407.1 tetratricopeptide repeat protein [Bizionia sp. M204]